MVVSFSICETFEDLQYMADANFWITGFKIMAVESLWKEVHENNVLTLKKRHLIDYKDLLINVFQESIRSSFRESHRINKFAVGEITCYWTVEGWEHIINATQYIVNWMDAWIQINFAINYSYFFFWFVFHFNVIFTEKGGRADSALPLATEIIGERVQERSKAQPITYFLIELGNSWTS